MMAERLARVHIGNMHFHKWNAHACERIANRHAGVGKRARVDDNPVGVAARRLDGVHNRALVVALKMAHAHAQLGGGFVQISRYIRQRFRAVNIRLARAQQV